MPACYSLAVVPLCEEKNHAPVRISSVDSGAACAQVLTEGAEN